MNLDLSYAAVLRKIYIRGLFCVLFCFFSVCIIHAIWPLAHPGDYLPRCYTLKIHPDSRKKCDESLSEKSRLLFGF